MSVSTALARFFNSTLETFLVLAPMLLLGLFIAGLTAVLIRRETIIRWMGGKGLRSVISASAFGAPVPLCSCGVVPVTMALRRKGASKPAAMSFLISTPESGADSILVTLGLLGPVMAIVRPVVSFFTAIVSGIMVIACIRDENSADNNQPNHHHEDKHEDSCTHHNHLDEVLDDKDYVGFKGIWDALVAAGYALMARLSSRLSAGSWYRPSTLMGSEQVWPAFNTESLTRIAKTVFRKGFIELLDDIVLNLLIGILLAGLITAFLPDSWIEAVSASSLGSMLLMLVIALPMYMCATTSTPIAAALLLKGISPGAALVFLLAGPATNISTILLLNQLFGRRFVVIYVGVIISVTLLAGFGLNILVESFDLAIEANLVVENTPLADNLEYISAALLLGLIGWRMAILYSPRMLLSKIKQKLLIQTNPGGEKHSPGDTLRHRRVAYIGLLLAVLYAGSGLHKVPPGSVGFSVLFGKVVQRDLPPGLHYAAPWPIGRFDTWHVDFPRWVEVDVGRQALVSSNASYSAEPASTSPAQNRSEYLSGDENLINMVVAVQYHIVNPYRYFYTVRDPESLVADVTKAIIQEYITQNKMEDLLSHDRALIEQYSLEVMPYHLSLRIDNREDNYLGIQLQAVSVMRAYPLQETMNAFRAIADAEQQRETAILEAEKIFIMTVPRAIGNAELEWRKAEAQAEGIRIKADAERDRFLVMAKSVSASRDLLQHLLWLETNERVMQGKVKYILPPTAVKSNLAIWEMGGKLPLTTTERFQHE